MITARELIPQIRLYCGMADHQTLPNWAVLTILHHKVDSMRAAMLNTDQNWIVGSPVDIPVGPGDEFIPVNAANFGKPVLIHTVDDSDAYHIKREIPIIDLQDEDRVYIGPKTPLIAPGLSPHVAQSFALLNIENQWTLKVQPLHLETATYRLWYKPDRPQPALLNDNLDILNAFVNLICVDTALTCLPNCLKEDGSNSAVIGMRVNQLTMDKGDYLQKFTRYVGSTRQEQASRKRGYGDGESLDVFWN